MFLGETSDWSLIELYIHSLRHISPFRFLLIMSPRRLCVLDARKSCCNGEILCLMRAFRRSLLRGTVSASQVIPCPAGCCLLRAAHKNSFFSAHDGSLPCLAQAACELKLVLWLLRGRFLHISIDLCLSHLISCADSLFALLVATGKIALQCLHNLQYILYMRTCCSLVRLARGSRRVVSEVF